VAILVLLVVALAGCGGDEETATVTVTTTVTETSAEEALPMGPAIAELQQVMTALGYYDGDIDGVYGEDTAAAVEAMQEDLGVTADGIYGTETHEALKDSHRRRIEIQMVSPSTGTHGRHRRRLRRETSPQSRRSRSDLGVTVDGRVGEETVTAFNEASRAAITPA
jgi:peptidoglycan hydrolase-like protein with peptidoglycan-binding domain